MIIQIERTSPFITGQQRLDIVLKNDNGILKDDSIHVVPLSDNVIFNENQKRPAYNYSQKENIKYLYEQTHQTFYDAVTDHGTNLVWSQYPIDTNDHTYQAGMKRIRHSRYGKSFSFLCPVWIDTEWEDDFCFRFSIRHKDSQQWLARRTMKPSEDLTKYLQEWFKDNSDELLNINTEKELATIKGCSVVSGADSIVDISYIIKNILTRERPLMEFDSILCDTFRQNHLIAKQFFNFNFIFDFTDIISAYAMSTIGAQPMNVQVEFGVLNGNTFVPFEKRDLYTNYDFIPEYSISSETYSSSDNVLDYLNDNLCVDNIYANKMVQPIFHWSLADNPDYLYNFYNGFSPMYGNEQINGMYYGTPMVGYSKYDEKLCNLNWVRTEQDIQFHDYEHQINDPKEFYTKLPINVTDSDSFWMDWLKYKKLNRENPFDSIEYFKINYCDNIPVQGDNVDLSIYTNPINDNEQSELICSASQIGVAVINEQDGNILTLFIDKNMLGVGTDPVLLDYFAIGQNNYRFEFTCSNSSEIEDVLNWIFEIKNNVISPEKFVFDKGVIPVKADKTLTSSNEIKYLKANKNSTVTLYRYTGHLIPMFIPFGNEKYNSDWRPKQFSNVGETTAQTINKAYIKKKQLDYPSLGWFTLENNFTGATSYGTLPNIPEGATDWFEDVCTDMCWYDASYGMNLPASWSTTYVANGGTSPFLNDEIAENILRDYLNISISPEMFHNNVWNLYTYSFDFDYVTPYNITDIEYHITYQLR